jgi:ATP synthase protein I
MSNFSNRPENGNSGKPDKGSSSDSELANRLDDLSSQLGKRKQVVEKIDINEGKANSAGIAQAMRLSSEFIAAIFVGAGLGYLVDTLAGSSPWGMIVFLFLGFGAGVLNVLRAAGKIAETNLHLGAKIDPKNDE